MRYIAIFLLLANIGYFGWARLQGDSIVEDEPPTPRPLLNSGITLVSEFQERQAAQPDLACFTVASFDTVDDASSFMGELGELAFDARLNLSGEPLSSQYRVFLPPASSRGIATIILDGLGESLSAAQIQVETYLITRGALENGIALGVFSELANAQSALSAVQGLGYAPQIEEIPRSTGEIQVSLQLLRRDVPENPAWPEFTAEWPDLSITENLCETIAQGSQFP